MGEGITTDFSRRMSYADYLGLDRLLSAQNPLTGQHDELLFITIHQVQELWLKLMLHEMDLAMDCIRRDELRPAFKATARIGRIQRQMIEAWDVLTTMTPHDYLAFRESLGASSGFQSLQYRLLEFRMGAKDPFIMKPHAHRPEAHAALRAALEAPSIYDEALRLLARRGHPIPAEVLERDLSKPHESHPAVVAAWAAIYGAGEKEMELYELAEELVDLEDGFGTWRFRHMRTVERIIGHRRGTGGSAGVSYLKGAVEKRFFPELYEARTAIA
ncbi:tryptophan 2,3-dioxygenase [Craurococcus roseus]|uniref:Tryptophan 2,3-dioxygenase n=1 Tax=Craurococcus roseus TaxID=77585 RepID=A0ABP3QDR9_9PROT